MAGKKYSSPEVSLYQTEDILINSYNVNIGSLYALDDGDEEPIEEQKTSKRGKATVLPLSKQ